MSTNLEGYTIEGLHEIKADLFTVLKRTKELIKTKPLLSAYICVSIDGLLSARLISYAGNLFLTRAIYKEIEYNNTWTLGTVAYKAIPIQEQYLDTPEEYVTRGNAYRVRFLNRLIRRVRTEISKREKV